MYKVRVDYIAQDIDDEVKNAILEFLANYDFPYSATVTDKKALKNIFTEHFQKRHSLYWLKDQIIRIAINRRGVTPIALCETNRLHTKGLGTVLLSKGQTKCTTVHTYGYTTPMSPECYRNLEGKTLDIKEIITNSFPKTVDELNRKDIAMIPQHVNCRHVMSPLE